MARGSSDPLTTRDASIVLGMIVRGDHDHDIAAWFGVNEHRIAEVKAGKHSPASAAEASELPPKGPPGVKGKRLKEAVDKGLAALVVGDIGRALEALENGKAAFEINEA